MMDRAHGAQLKQARQSHLSEAQGPVRRLEQVFAMLRQAVKGTTCAASV